MKYLFIFSIIAALVFAEKSYYKYKINQSFAEEIAIKNLHIIFNHTDSIKVGHAYLPESGTTIEDIDLKVMPIGDETSTKKRKDIETSLELDAERNLIILNLYNLEFGGSADMTVDNVKEKFTIQAEFSVARIVLSFSTSTTNEGNVVPQVEV